jgi:hypothetical protein
MECEVCLHRSFDEQQDTRESTFGCFDVQFNAAGHGDVLAHACVARRPAAISQSQLDKPAACVRRVREVHGHR